MFVFRNEPIVTDYILSPLHTTLFSLPVSELGSLVAIWRHGGEGRNDVTTDSLFFFFYDIDERKRYTKKGASPKGLSWPLHREKKNKRRFVGWVGVEGVCGCGS